MSSYLPRPEMKPAATAWEQTRMCSKRDAMRKAQVLIVEMFPFPSGRIHMWARAQPMTYGRFHCAH